MSRVKANQLNGLRKYPIFKMSKELRLCDYDDMRGIFPVLIHIQVGSFNVTVVFPYFYGPRS